MGIRARHLGLFSAIACVIVLSGCGDDSRSVDASAAGEAPVPVRITEYRFDPKHLTVRRGQSLEVKNDGEIAHNLTIEKGSNPRRQSDALTGTGSFLPGGRVRLEIDIPPGRTYAFACTVPGHRALGMYGTLRVR